MDFVEPIGRNMHRRRFTSLCRLLGHFQIDLFLPRLYLSPMPFQHEVIRKVPAFCFPDRPETFSLRVAAGREVHV